MIKVFVAQNDLYEKEVKYSWDLFALNKKLPYVFVNSLDKSEISIGDDTNYTIRISKLFYEKLAQKKYYYTHYFETRCLIENEDGAPDYLSTAFYMVNCIQEIDHLVVDHYGRFPYNESYQKKFNCVTQNLVQEYFDALYNSIETLTKIPVKKNPTQIFLSHDVDTIYGSLLEDGFHAVKKGSIGKFFKMLKKNMAHYPYWLNMNEMMNIEEEHNFKSTFFWLVNKDRISPILKNADYSVEEPKVKSAIKEISKRGFFNGLHKSASETNFSEEIKSPGMQIISNRYHYLKFNPHKDFKKIESAGIKLDSSLGFAEMYGFRNNYGMPYRPFDLTERRTLNLVECPLNIMDGTFFNYQKINAEKTYSLIEGFIRSNKSDCIISVLFHNPFITEFKFGDFRNAFIKLLEFFNRENFNCITQNEIIKSYFNEH